MMREADAQRNFSDDSGSAVCDNRIWELARVWHDRRCLTIGGRRVSRSVFRYRAKLTAEKLIDTWFWSNAASAAPLQARL